MRRLSMVLALLLAWPVLASAQSINPGTDRLENAQRQADSRLAHDESAAGRLDELTYRLVIAGATHEATRVLLRAFPFAGRPAAERDTLLQRLMLLIEQQRSALSDGQLRPLRDPLDTPALRGRQAALWASLGDCGAVRSVLSDMSPAYSHDDWMRLGDCSTADDPVLAQQAYGRAHASRPGGLASRALAYQAHATGDFVTALDAWRTVSPERLSSEVLLAAVTTALAAGEEDQAAHWLSAYRDRGDTLDHRYWSLVADSARRDPLAAAAALERAVEWHPNPADYRRLAGLARHADQQVRWLERAAELDPDYAHGHAELGYAYMRARRPASALHAFQRAAVLDPDNMDVQIELGYAYWRDGRAADARRALERAWHADPANLALARQLVYVHQRLKHNDTARWYVRQLLDAPAAWSDEGTGRDTVTTADRRFGLQRLHEELGRRTTVSLDGWSGTRVSTGTSTSQAGGRYNSYSQFEVDVRLGNPPVRNGSTVSAYARIFADGGAQRSPVPSEHAMLGAGIRWKPWRSQVLYLAAENQQALERPGRRDVLLRASASFLNGGRYGDDWHASRGGWFSHNLYLDGAQYLETMQRALVADYRASYHHKMSASQTLEPYGRLQVSAAGNRRFQRDVRSGAGVRWNIWHGATRYNAAPHKVSVGIEFQQAFETYLIDRRGVFATFGARW